MILEGSHRPLKSSESSQEGLSSIHEGREVCDGQESSEYVKINGVSKGQVSLGATSRSHSNSTLGHFVKQHDFIAELSIATSYAGYCANVALPLE